LDDLADLDFDTRTRQGAELQHAVEAAIAGRERDALVTALADAGVPVAPVLRRSEMLAAAPFPPFPIRLDLPERPGAVPALDEHHGQGFRT
jgi:crotonobetainyl-CoA:carnitine CoA-transferase CaiB-like acyl-CoA transferase